MIVVLGSINCDLVVPVGTLPGAGETVLGGGMSLLPGGKGANQALAARRAGAEVRMIGCVGRDGFAEPALALLAAGGVDLSGVRRDGSSTGVAMIAVDAAGENQIVVASGANADVSADWMPDAWVGRGHLLLLQMEIDPEETLAAARRARRAGGRIVLNLAPARPIPEDALADIDVLVANEGEIAVLAAALGVRDGDPLDIARVLSARSGGAVVVTLGAAGAVAAAGGLAWRVGAPVVDVVDTTGAGDAAVGALAAALDRGLDLADALGHAVAAGSLACTAPGAQPGLPTAGAIEALVAVSPPARRVL